MFYTDKEPNNTLIQIYELSKIEGTYILFYIKIITKFSNKTNIKCYDLLVWLYSTNFCKFVRHALNNFLNF